MPNLSGGFSLVSFPYPIELPCAKQNAQQDSDYLQENVQRIEYDQGDHPLLQEGCAAGQPTVHRYHENYTIDDILERKNYNRLNIE